MDEGDDPTMGGKRQKGVRKKPLSFKAPDTLNDYVRHLEATENKSLTDICVELMEIGMELKKGLSPRWGQVIARAYDQKATKGQVLLQMLRDGLACLEGAQTDLIGTQAKKK